MQKITGTFSNIHVGTDTKTKFVADLDQQEFNFVIDNIVPFDKKGFKYLFNYNVNSRIKGFVDFTTCKGYIQVLKSLNLRINSLKIINTMIQFDFAEIKPQYK